MGRRKIPNQLEGLVSQTVKNYLHARKELQKFIDMTNWIKGRCGDYVFQTSHGTQQIKRYEPKKYKNEVNTPLRTRIRTIMRLASQDPSPTKEEKLRFLMKTYPYHLDKEEPVNLRLLNFYFDYTKSDEIVRIYKKRAGEEPDPELDDLIHEVEYIPKKTIKFNFQEEDEEWYYGLKVRTGELSNVLHFLWE